MGVRVAEQVVQETPQFCTPHLIPPHPTPLHLPPLHPTTHASAPCTPHFTPLQPTQMWPIIHHHLNSRCVIGTCTVGTA